MDFPRFSDLPEEIRQQIWLDAIPTRDDDVPEVCIVWPLNLQLRDGAGPCRPFVVDVGFSVLMHTCRESRAVAQNTARSGLRYRESPAAGVRVPFRAFRPEMDTLFWGNEAIRCLMECWKDFDFLADVTHLAIESEYAFARWPGLVSAILSCFHSLRTLSVAFADDTNDNVFRCSFQPPARRCRVKRIEHGGPGEMTVGPENPGAPQSGAPERLSHLLQHCRSTMQDCVYESVGRSVPDSSPFDRVAWNFDRLAIGALTFEEHQPDGTWKQVCRERKYGEPHRVVPNSPFIPVSERRNPEEYRVNDDDAAFAGVYESTVRNWDNYM